VQVFQVREQAQQAQEVGEADFRSSEQRTSLLRPAACSTRTWLSGEVCTRPTHHMGTHHLFASATSRFIRLPFTHQCGREPVLSLKVADSVPQQFGNEYFMSHVQGLLLRAVDAELCSILPRLSRSTIIDWLRRTVKFRASKAVATPSMRRNPRQQMTTLELTAGNQGHGR